MHVPWSGDGQNGKKSRRSEETYSFDGEYFTITPYQTETEYHGGMLRTHRDMAYLYGYVEESAKLPTAKGFWTALWTGDVVSFGFYGDEQAAKEQLLGVEIDINENFGANYVAANCHSWPTELGKSLGYQHTSTDGNEYSNDKKYYPDKGFDLHDDFHTYGFMWTPEYMSFTCDGRVYFTYKFKTEQDELSFHQKMYLTLSMAVGLKSGSTSIGLATEDDWANKSTMVVDYVHLYQLQDGKSMLDLRENTYGK
jgi:beta-glucanase (GH16 family)